MNIWKSSGITLGTLLVTSLSAACLAENEPDRSPVALGAALDHGPIVQCVDLSEPQTGIKQTLIDGVLVVRGTRGDDQIDCSAASHPVDLTAGRGDDIVTGSAFGDVITGGGGSDYLDGAGGADDISGGSGDDTILGGAGDDIELDGGGGDDFVFGGDGDDLLNGGPGKDGLYGEDDADVCNGGPGDDTFGAGCEVQNDSNNPQA